MKQVEMKRKPKLSVALCTYNGEKFLQEQLESIYNQESPVDEIVICDDNSQDNTIDIVNQFKKNHPEIEIKIHKNESNIGVLSNFEKAISLCHGDIIFCSDQDDIWMKEKTKIIVSWFDTHPETELVFTDAVLIDKDGYILCESTLFDTLQFSSKVRKLWKQGLTLELYNIRNWVTGATIAFKKTIVHYIIPFIKDTHCLHDEQIAITCVKRNSIHMMEECLTKYRIHGNNVIGIHLGKRQKIRLYAPLEVRKYLEIIYNYNYENENRVVFLKERNKNCKTIKRRLKTIISISKYYKYYKRYFLYYYFTDLIVGLDEFAKNKYRIFKSKIIH